MSPAASARPDALCFDVFGTLVDPFGIQRRLEEHVGPAASRVTEIWRQKQLEYTFRLTAMEWYRDFGWVTRRSLLYALQATGQDLRPAGALGAHTSADERGYSASGSVITFTTAGTPDSSARSKAGPTWSGSSTSSP